MARPRSVSRKEALALRDEVSALLARDLSTFTKWYSGSRNASRPPGVSLGLSKFGKSGYRVAVRVGYAERRAGRRRVRLSTTVRAALRARPEWAGLFDVRTAYGLSLGARGGAHPMWFNPSSNSYYQTRPLPPGAPLAADECRTAFGSAGFHVRHSKTGELRLLTCAHVVEGALAVRGNANVLQAPRALFGFPPNHTLGTVAEHRRASDAVLNGPETALLALAPRGPHPAPPDGARSANQFLPRRLPRRYRTRNVAGITGTRDEYEKLWWDAAERNTAPEFVSKVGAASGWTHGLVTTVLDGLDVPIGDALYHFVGPILEVSGYDGGHFARPGDSGSPILDAAGRLVGVVFATDPDLQLAFAFPARAVLDAWPEYSLLTVPVAR